MVINKFIRCQSNHYVYYKKIINGNYFILILYMDDMLVVGSNMHDIVVLEGNLAKNFEIKYLGEAK